MSFQANHVSCQYREGVMDLCDVGVVEVIHVLWTISDSLLLKAYYMTTCEGLICARSTGIAVGSSVSCITDAIGLLGAA
jgi:hypothetical protein